MASPPGTLNARVGLLLATRDQADHLHHALSSLLAQTHPLLTLTVVDDGSRDRTPEVLAHFSSDKRLQVITTRPQGLLPSLNLALQKSKPAAYYAVAYASCFYSFNFLESMLDELLRHPRASGIFCCYCETFAGQPVAILQEPRFDANELLVRNGLGPGIIFRAEAFKQAGGIFLSEKKGLWETWQRMAAQGPFIKYKDMLVRWTPLAYDTPPPEPPLDPEQDLYPKLKVRGLVLSGDGIDRDWLQLMQEAGHSLGTPEQFKEAPQLVLCGSMKHLPEALEQARRHNTPLMLVSNESGLVKELRRQPRLRFLLGSTSIATHTLKVAQQLQSLQHQALVYMHGMTPREVNRLLTRVPMLLWRHRTVVVIRAYGSPHCLEQTLRSLRYLNRPPDFGQVLIHVVDQHPELIRWLKAHDYTWFAAGRHAYYPELLFLLRQLRASYVLCLDAGVLPAADYFTTLWPELANPLVGMVSGHLNEGPGSQNLPMKANSPAELMQYWPRYRPSHPVEPVDKLSDSAFLIRKSVLEWALAAHPETLPLSDETLFSRLLGRAGYRLLLQRKTVAFNLTQAL